MGAKVTYDLSGVDDLADDAQAPVGTYIGKIEAAEAKTSGNGNPMIEVRWLLTHGADGTKLKEIYAPIWDYPILEHESKFVMGKTKAFFAALGLKPKGSIDVDKLVGMKAQLKLKSDTDDGGDYRPRIGKILPLNSAEDSGATEPEEEEPEAEPEGDNVDLSVMSRDELKKFIRAEKLGTLADLGIKSNTSDDAIRDIIADKMGGEPEAEPEEEEPEAEPEPEEEGINLDELDRDALKKLIKEEKLGTLAELGINRNTTDDQIRTIIATSMGGEPEGEPEAEPEDEPEGEPDGDGDDGYDGLDINALAADFKERDLDQAPLKGLKGVKLKAKVIELLRADDAASPF